MKQQYVDIVRMILPLFNERTAAYRRVYSAWNSNDLFVVLCGDTYWFERCDSDRVYEDVKEAMGILGFFYLYDAVSA